MLSEKKYKIGVDFGGSHFGVAITDDIGTVLSKIHMNIDVSNLETQEEKEKAIMDNIIPIIEECIQVAGINRDDINFIGIGVPGAYEGTRIVYLPNMGLRDFDIGEAFRNRMSAIGLEASVLLENDGNCAAVGELVAGALKGVQNGINIVFGTGVGGGLILNGKLYRGENNCGGEIGHMIVGKHANIECGCGQIGCLETLCSVKRLRENVSRILNLDYTIDGIELEKILNETDNEDVKRLYETYKEDLILSLVSIVNMFDPKRISIGGSLSYFIEPELDEITRKVREQSFSKRAYEIVKATLENDAGLIGAAMLEKYVI